MHAVLRRIKKMPWLNIAIASAILLGLWFLFPAVKSVFSLLNKVGKGVTSAIGKFLGFAGLDPEINDKADSVDKQDANNPWLSSYIDAHPFLQSGSDLPLAEWEATVLQNLCKDMSVKVIAAHNFFSVTYKSIAETKILFTELFHDKQMFSYFCKYWQQKQGSTLADYYRNGWIFGLVGSWGNSDFVWFVDYVNALPEN